MYQYDVFISYERRYESVARWVRNHFHPVLRSLLDGNLDREAGLFYDESVQFGGKWPEELRYALKHTRILIPVCSPKYFVNEWCRAEWASMARRETLVGGERPATLIYPVIYCDSRNFPDYALERRMHNLTEFNHPYEHFEDSPKYIQFHDKMNLIAEEVEALLSTVPEWQPGWPAFTPEPEPPRSARLPRL